jgi:hypothetical protein
MKAGTLFFALTRAVAVTIKIDLAGMICTGDA